MDNQDDQTQPVQDADIIINVPGIGGEPPDADSTAAQVMLDLEQLIKTNVANIDRGKAELKKLREMENSALENDETYRLHNEEAKKAAKQKSATKAQIMALPANKQLANKIKDIAEDIKEADGALSDYLREYGRMSGTNEIETEDGQIREIVYLAKLIKKSTRQG